MELEHLQHLILALGFDRDHNAKWNRLTVEGQPEVYELILPTERAAIQFGPLDGDHHTVKELDGVSDLAKALEITCEAMKFQRRIDVEIHSLTRGLAMPVDDEAAEAMATRGLAIWTRMASPTQTGRMRLTAQGELRMKETANRCRVKHCPCHLM